MKSYITLYIQDKKKSGTYTHVSDSNNNERVKSEKTSEYYGGIGMILSIEQQ